MDDSVGRFSPAVRLSIMRLLRFAAAAALSGLLGCALSTPSPWSAAQNDPTPRVLAKGRMNTLIAFGDESHGTPLRWDHLLLAQSYGVTDKYTVTALVDGGGLYLERADSLGDLEDEGLYASLGFKKAATFREGLPAAMRVALGWGSYGDYVSYVDGLVGYGFGTRGKYCAPFVTASAGFSVPYRRTIFDFERVNILAPTREMARYRFASTVWSTVEGGLEFPFGGGPTGARVWVLYGLNYYQMLEKDIVEEKGMDDTTVVSLGGSNSIRVGISYSY
jgi:hypothetical protein